MTFDRAFVAATVALGGTLDEALACLDNPDAAPELARGLRAKTRPARAQAMALAIHEVLAAVDEGKLA